MMGDPSLKGDSGRDAHGRFQPGNTFGRGNPLARQQADFRKTLYHAMTLEDFQSIARKLIERAKAGDMVAIKLVLLWYCGHPPVSASDDLFSLIPDELDMRGPGCTSLTERQWRRAALPTEKEQIEAVARMAAERVAARKRGLTGRGQRFHTPPEPVRALGTRGSGLGLYVAPFSERKIASPSLPRSPGQPLHSWRAFPVLKVYP